MTVYPTLDEVLSVHKQLIERLVEAMDFGIRAAWNRLWRDHKQVITWIDGNKRVAITVSAAFLRVNGCRLEFDDFSAYSFLIDLYESGRMRFDHIDRWLRKHAIIHPATQ